ncbi:MAG: trehalose 6-phosphate synthase/phosphatase [Verrucomicrobiales bacterium]
MGLLSFTLADGSCVVSNLVGKTILVSNRLPVRLAADGTPERTTGGLASALSGAKIDAMWVGWPGVAEEEVADRPALEKAMAQIGVKPVMLTTEDLSGFYEGYTNSTLWPLFHYMVNRAEFDYDWFSAYEVANRKFADAVLDIAEDGDSIWIHDYHLMLLPQLLRNSDRKLRVGFFLHTPFPSSDVFRALPDRQRLLNGLLGADIIGFHTYNYLRHFRSSLLRVLGSESQMDAVWIDEHPIHLGVYPIGHDHNGFSAVLGDDNFENAVASQARNLNGKRLVLSVERLDYTKGIPEKLAAIRTFLERNAELRADVLFVIIAVPSRQGVQEYTDLTEEVQQEVSSINGEFGSVGHSPVQFLFQSFPQADLAALYVLAEICLVTPLIDGMNLVAKEFIACKHCYEKATPGVLVLSEFAGAAQEMSHALLINPYDVREVADAMATALAMGTEERIARTTAMGSRLVRTDAAAWANLFMSDLHKVELREKVAERSASLLDLADSMAARVRAGESVALFLDYDGTLRGFVDDPDAAVPDDELCPLLQELSKHMLVSVISGRPMEFLEQHFGGLGITLVAEHGYRWSRAESPEWALIHPGIDTGWQDDVRPHLQQAADLTPGTSIEEKRSSLVWHYRRAEPEFGLWQAKGLLAELTDVTASMPVSVHHGNMIVEVASQLVNKGIAVKQLINKWQPKVAFAAGDDKTDETMFALEPELDDVDFITVNVGKSSTRAQRRTDINGLRAFLESLRDSLSKK